MSPLETEIGAFLTEKQRKRSVATGDQYRFILERVWLPWCRQAGIASPSDCDSKCLDRFQDDLAVGRGRAKPLSVASIRTYVRGVRIFLSWADVPKGKFEAVAEPERLRDTLSREEVRRIERAARDERDRLIVRILADCGLRVSELLGLRGQDLREDSNRHRYFLRVIGKGNREREVGVPEDTFKRLRHFAAYQEEPEFIFRSKRGAERLTRNGAEQVIRNLAREAKIGRRVWPHLFRFSYITEMARKNVPIADVMKAVGHKSPIMTMKVYNMTTAADSYDRLMAALRG